MRPPLTTSAADRPWHLIQTDAALEEALPALHGVPRLAVDTESNSFHAYREQVCFIQISPGEEEYLIDTVTVDPRPLGPLFADDGVCKVLHGADYDIRCLGRDFGLRIAGLFDTSLAARFLGYQKHGLDALVEQAFGVRLSKKYSRHDWRRRPLGEAERAYLLGDVRYLFGLHDRLAAELDAGGIREEVELEFRYLEKQEWNPSGFDPEGWRAIKGRGELGRNRSRLLAALYLYRECQALHLNRPAFKVLSKGALLNIARRAPKRQADLERIRGLGSWATRELGEDLLQLAGGTFNWADLKEREELLEEARVEKARRDREAERSRGISKGARGREKRLRQWRREEAEGRGCYQQVVLPTRILKELASHPPQSRTQLAAVEGLGNGRLDRYGERLLELCDKRG